MTDLMTSLAAATGQAPPREVVEAREGLTRAQRRAAGRAARRGAAVDDPAVARLAVAYARLFVRRRPGRVVTWGCGLMVAFFAAGAVAAFGDGHVVGGAFLALSAPLTFWAFWRLRPAAFEAARAAERRNRERLERAGRPYREDAGAAEPVRPPAGAVVAGAVGAWAFYDLVYGGLGDLLAGRSLSFAHVVVRGAIFATFMTVANLTVIRRRTKRQSQRPIA